MAKSTYYAIIIILMLMTRRCLRCMLPLFCIITPFHASATHRSQDTPFAKLIRRLCTSAVIIACHAVIYTLRRYMMHWRDGELYAAGYSFARQSAMMPPP